MSLFRRPRPSTNLPFLVQVMWDGREPTLAHQAADATLGHAQAAQTDPMTMAAIAQFESTLVTAQQSDSIAGVLPGPAALATQPFHPGINDAFGGDPTGAAFDRDVFTIYAAWATETGTSAEAQRRAAIARGEHLFDTRQFTITNVAGVPPGPGTCSTCHDAPNVGSHSVALAINLGPVAPVRRTPDMPLYTLHNTADNSTIQVTDPGRALVTGKWADVGKFYVPVLRDLAARPPYFHDGSAPNLGAVIAFYDHRFAIQLTPQERADLEAFLASL